MKNRLLGLVMAGMLVLIGSVASADTKTISDGKDPDNGGIDIKSATAGHTPTGKLKHKIGTYDQIGDMEQACLFITTVEGDYFTCGYRMYDSNDNETGGVTESRPDNKTIIFKFKKSAIGSPDFYSWRVEAGNYCSGTDCDRAPNKGMVPHKL